TEPKVQCIAEEPTGTLLASPLGIVSHSHATRLVLIDPATGETRASLPRRSRSDMPGAIVGQVYVTLQPTEEAFDLLTGRSLWKQKAGEQASLSTRELVVRLLRREDVLDAKTRADTRSAPRKKAWRWPTKTSRLERVDGTALSLGGGAVVLGGSPRFVALDARTGAERFAGDGWVVLVDAAGLVVHDESSVTSFTHGGEVLWRKKGYSQIDALAPGFVVARVKQRLALIDRATGARRALLPPEVRLLAVARDVLYLHEPARIFEGQAPRLSAHDAEGRRLWRFEFAPRQGMAVQAAAPMAGRLLVALRSHFPNRVRNFIVSFVG
ncbi:MAG: hypothetical protein ACAI25_16670, partial [Planctomycetota bacterium]